MSQKHIAKEVYSLEGILFHFVDIWCLTSEAKQGWTLMGDLNERQKPERMVSEWVFFVVTWANITVWQLQEEDHYAYSRDVMVHLNVLNRLGMVCTVQYTSELFEYM